MWIKGNLLWVSSHGSVLVDHFKTRLLRVRLPWQLHSLAWILSLILLHLQVKLTQEYLSVCQATAFHQFCWVSSARHSLGSGVGHPTRLSRFCLLRLPAQTDGDNGSPWSSSSWSQGCQFHKACLLLKRCLSLIGSRRWARYGLLFLQFIKLLLLYY